MTLKLRCVLDGLIFVHVLKKYISTYLNFSVLQMQIKY